MYKINENWYGKCIRYDLIRCELTIEFDYSKNQLRTQFNKWVFWHAIQWKKSSSIFPKIEWMNMNEKNVTRYYFYFYYYYSIEWYFILFYFINVTTNAWLQIFILCFFFMNLHHSYTNSYQSLREVEREKKTVNDNEKHRIDSYLLTDRQKKRDINITFL